MDRFTVDNALYFGPVETEAIKDMSRERLLRLVVELMNEQDRTRERHANEREILTGQANYRRWRL